MGKRQTTPWLIYGAWQGEWGVREVRASKWGGRSQRSSPQGVGRMKRGNGANGESYRERARTCLAHGCVRLCMQYDMHANAVEP